MLYQFVAQGPTINQAIGMMIGFLGDIGMLGILQGIVLVLGAIAVGKALYAARG